MIRNMFLSASKTEAFRALIEAISSGVNLLNKDNLTESIVSAWENYAKSTVELVDSAFSTCYSIGFERSYNISSFFMNQDPLFNPNYARTAFKANSSVVIKSRLYSKIQELISIAKNLPQQ